MPLGNAYANQSCSIASTLEVVGERWTLLIVREVMLGVHRFDEFQADLGIARNILQARLQRLVAAGILERRRYQEHPERHGYHLTDVGRDLWPVIVSLMQWGDTHAPRAGGPPVRLEHRDCGGEVDSHRICSRCGARLSIADVLGIAGESTDQRHPLRRRAAVLASPPEHPSETH